MKSVTLRRPALREELRRYLLAFLLGFGSLLVVILPIIIADGGYYIYYGDYNSQQIPFYNLANDAVRSGSFGWNWYTDLGVNFIGSYAFYLLGSPFFWLTTILPRSWVTFAMPVLLCMETRHRLSDGIRLYPAVCTQSSRCHDRRPAVCLFRLPAVQHFLQPLSGRDRVFSVAADRHGRTGQPEPPRRVCPFGGTAGSDQLLFLYRTSGLSGAVLHRAVLLKGFPRIAEKSFSSFCWRQSLA